MAVVVAPRVAYAFIVRAVYQGQQIINKLNYVTSLKDPAPVGGVNAELSLYLFEFQNLWQTAVLPAMSDEYEVIEYVASRVHQVNSGPGGRPDVIYQDSTVRLGGAGDVGAITFDEALPTFNAMNCRKLCVVVDRFTRGSMRVGPFQESDQVDGLFAPAIVATWEGATGDLVDTALIGDATALSEMKLIVLGATNLIGVAAPIILSAAQAANWRVVDIVCQRRVSSQVSRKPSVMGH